MKQPTGYDDTATSGQPQMDMTTAARADTSDMMKMMMVVIMGYKMGYKNILSIIRI